MEQTLSTETRAGLVVIDNVKVKTTSKEIISANILDVEVGTTGYCGGDTGHGGRTYLRISNVASTDLRCRIKAKGEFYDFGECMGADQIEIMLGGDCELGTFIEALEFAVEALRSSMTPKSMTPQEKKQDDFRHYLSKLVALYRKTGKLNGMSDCKKNYHCSGITKIQFFELGLHDAAKDNVELLDADFCKKVYDFVLGKADAPRYAFVL